MPNDNNLDVRVQWHAPDAVFAAVFLRDGEPWVLNGALVGLASTRGRAVDDLMGLAAYLVVHGENFLTDVPIGIEDREWLFDHLDWGGQTFGDPGDTVTNDQMYTALRDARTLRIVE